MKIKKNNKHRYCMHADSRNVSISRNVVILIRKVKKQKRRKMEM